MKKKIVELAEADLRGSVTSYVKESNAFNEVRECTFLDSVKVILSKMGSF